MTRIVIAAVASSVLVGYAAGAQTRGQWIYGQGNSSCGKWLESRAAEQMIGRRVLSASEIAQLYSGQGWVLGFISGAAWDSNGDAGTTRETDSVGIFAAVDKECIADPTQAVYRATQKVYLTLAGQ